jgi:alkanesulfonate monooxygenase SsuD/methylene tetrahydromethanopterin reductase-like flavin-dependent oxidoreductase (luciferase family)
MNASMPALAVSHPPIARAGLACATATATWAGKSLEGAGDPVGPMPYTEGGPPIVLGGASGPALRRAGERADAWLSAPASPQDIAANYATVIAAAERAGRPAPRLLAAHYFALGDVDDEVRHNVQAYYAVGGPGFVEAVYGAVLRSPDAITQTLSALENIGVEEVCLWPQAHSIDQLHDLATVLGK